MHRQMPTERIEVVTGLTCNALAAPLLRATLVMCLAITLAACGGGGDTVLANCKRGLITGFGGNIDDLVLQTVDEQEGQGGTDGDGSVGNGEGIGLGGDDGQYLNVDVSVELATGPKFGPWPIDRTKGMVTYVHCGGLLPAKVTFSGTEPDSSYYDEGRKQNLSFTGKTRIGLISSHEKNVGVTPFTEALYERAMQIGAERGLDEGWKDPSVVEQAHRELLAIVNDQLPGIYRLTDLRRLPVMLNASNDRDGSGTLTNNQNGIYGADIAGLSLAASTTLPGSVSPALDIAQTIISDLADGQLDLVDREGRPLADTGRVPYTYDTLWSMMTVGAGETASRNGRDGLDTSAVPIGLVRSQAAPGHTGEVRETLYVLGSNGVLVASINPSSNDSQLIKPAAETEFSALYRFGLEPVVALRRDGRGILVFPTSWDGTLSFEVSPPSAAVTMVEMFDAGYPVIRMSDGGLFRLQGSTLIAEPAPAGMLNYSCRDQFAGALLNENDATLGAAGGALCYGLDAGNSLRVWHAGTAPTGRVIELGRLRQVHGNTQITMAVLTDGSLYQLDNDHAVLFRRPDGQPVAELTGGEIRELVSPQASALRIDAPAICWVRAPFVVGCDGTAYQLEYREYLDTNGRFVGAGPITGLRQLPIPAPVWRPLLNRQMTVGDVKLGTDSVFIGTDGLVYDTNGSVLDLPLEGAPQQRTDQPPLPPTISSVATDDVLDRNEADAPLTVNGLAQPGSSVTASFNGLQKQTNADGNGRWQLVFQPGELPTNDGPAVLEVVASNPYGASAPATRTINVLRSLPGKPTINTVEGDNTITAAERSDGVALTGTAMPGSTVRVTWVGVNRNLTAAADRSWSLTIEAGEIPGPGTSEISVTASNLNGSSEPAVLTVRILPDLPQAPGINTVAGDNTVSADEAANGVSISGSGTPGSDIRIDWAGVIKTTTVDSASNWSVFYTANEIPAPGQTTVSAVASNAAGSSNTTTQAVLIEQAPAPGPRAPTIDPIEKDDFVGLEDVGPNNGVDFSGSATPGQALDIRWLLADGSSTVLTTKAQADRGGRWALSVPYAMTTADSVLEVQACTAVACGSVRRGFKLDARVLPRIVKVSAYASSANNVERIIPDGGRYVLDTSARTTRFEVTVSIARGLYEVQNTAPARGQVLTKPLRTVNFDGEVHYVYDDATLAREPGTHTYSIDALFANRVRATDVSRYTVTIN